MGRRLTAGVRIKTSAEYGEVHVLDNSRLMPPEHIFANLWHGVVQPVAAAFTAELYRDFRRVEPHAFPDCRDIIDGKHTGRLPPYAELTGVWGRNIASNARQQVMIVMEMLRVMQPVHERYRKIWSERAGDEQKQAEQAFHLHPDNALAWMAANLRIDMLLFYIHRHCRGMSLLPKHLQKFDFPALLDRMDQMCWNGPDTRVRQGTKRCVATIIGVKSIDVGFDPDRMNRPLAAECLVGA